jgi:hypothetical protein
MCCAGELPVSNTLQAFVHDIQSSRVLSGTVILMKRDLTEAMFSRGTK